MSWRKWFVRGLVLFIVTGCACALVWYQRFTNPAAVRQQVLDKFSSLFPGAEVTVESAQLRILGGISVNEIRLVRRDDPDKAELVRIPSAILYHDKQKLPGAMVLYKIELKKPSLKGSRTARATWTQQGLA